MGWKISPQDENLSEWYRVADIFVLPSFSEGKPIAIYEAMASECAIIASNVNGIPEQVENGVNGFLIKPGNTEDIMKKMIYLLKNRDILGKMKRRSRELIFEHGYTWDSYVKRVTKIYEELTKGKT